MDFIKQAYTGDNSFLSYVITLIILFVFWQVLGPLPLMGVSFAYAPNLETLMADSQNLWMNLGIPSNLYLLVMLLSFIMAFGGLWIGIAYIHKRSLKSVLTTRVKFDWSRVKLAGSIWFVVMLSMTLIDYFTRPEDFVLIFDAPKFAVLFIIAILVIPIQTTFEELLFRGYLMQALGTLSKNRWVPLLVTSVIFGLLHGANPEVAKLGPMMFIFYIGTGFLLGIMTLMDEGTELSIGFHAVNNVTAAILVTTDWTVFQTHAVFKDISEPELNLIHFLPLFIIYPALLLVFAKILGWKDWKSKLFGRVE